MAAESAGRIETGSAVVTRPFDYGTVITYTFESAHWQATRFSDGTRYGVWYGSWDATTTVYETAYHWSRFVRDSFGTEDRAIRTERRLFDVRCDALLIDLRGKEKAYPGLVDRKSYAFCQQVGRHVHEQGQNGLLVRSARCDGVNAAIIPPERLRDVRDKLFLTYRLQPGARPARRRAGAGRAHGSGSAPSALELKIDRCYRGVIGLVRRCPAPTRITSAPRCAKRPTVTTPAMPLIVVSSACGSSIVSPSTSRITLPLSVVNPMRHAGRPPRRTSSRAT